MDDNLIQGLLSWIIIASVVIGIIKNRLSNSAALVASKNALVVKALEVNETGPVYVHIVGRKPGILAWLRSLIGIDPTTTLKVMDNRVEFIEGSMSGQVTHMIPLSSVCNLGAGYSKPFVLLVVAIIMLVIGLITMVASVPACVPLVLILLAICFAAVYYLKKTLVLFILPLSSMGACIGLKRSVIEGVDLDEATAFRIIDIVSALIEKNAAK